MPRVARIATSVLPLVALALLVGCAAPVLAPQVDTALETVVAAREVEVATTVAFTEGPTVAEDGTVYFTDLGNNRLLIERLAGVPDPQRGAHYVCHVAVSDPGGEVRLSVEATCRGRIVEEARGENGFGYDPHFLLREYHRTFGELAPVVKQQLSHRARALARLIPELVGLLRG